MSDERWFLRRGTTTRDGWQVTVTPAGTDWRHTTLRVADLGPADVRELVDVTTEHLVVPLSGSVRVTALTGNDTGGDGGDGYDIVLAGRPGVFAGPTDVAYLPAGFRFTVRAQGGPARVAVAGAVVSGPPGRSRGSADPPRPRRRPRHVTVGEVPVERRGAGGASREVRNFGTPGTLAAEAIIACEVVTPAGNVSSWPPHKHDVERPGLETALEEIYYFETLSTDPRGTDPVGYQRVHASDERPIDVCAEVRTGDVVLVPYGWHGPSTAAPDAHLYYLNVMAGPGPERAWRICDDPAHAWVRDTWRDQPFDERLPLPGTSPPGGTA